MSREPPPSLRGDEACPAAPRGALNDGVTWCRRPRWEDPEDAALKAQNGAVQTFFEALERQGLEVDTVAEVMELFDADSSGTVSRAELEQGMRALGVSMDNASARLLVSALDTNGDGEVSHAELSRRLACRQPLGY